MKPYDDITIDVGAVSSRRVAELASVPIAYAATGILDPQPCEAGVGVWTLVDRAVPRFEKDYDRIPGGHPRDWMQRFDTAGWRIVLARSRVGCIGAATLACRTPGLDMLDGRRDRGVLWDLRVAPAARGHGLGARLFREIEAICRSMGLKELLVETQNVNAVACRFYERMGCSLAAVEPAAYPELPDETRMLWLKTL